MPLVVVAVIYTGKQVSTRKKCDSMCPRIPNEVFVLFYVQGGGKKIRETCEGHE